MNTKRSIHDLAAFGGPPAFTDPLHVGRPSLPRQRDLLPRIASVLDRSWYTNAGPLVEEFEHRVASLLGVRYCVAVANGTAGLEVLLRALELKGEVIVPAYTFVATAHALRWLGLSPGFSDVDLRTHNIDPAEVQHLLNDETAAILGVHLWGRPCAVDALSALAAAHHIPLLFDAAQAFGCSLGSTRIGNFGVAEVFSFHATKVVTAGEGGAVTTNDEGLAQRLRLLRNFGFAGVDNVVSVGTNAKMSEFAAAVALTSLDGMPEVIAANEWRYERYRTLLAGVPSLSVAAYDPHDTPNYQYVFAEVATRPTGITRDDLVALLRAENVLARRYFFPGCHRVEPHSREEPRRPLLATERLASSVMALPTGMAVCTEAIEAVASLIAYVFENEASIVSKLRVTQRV